MAVTEISRLKYKNCLRNEYFNRKNNIVSLLKLEFCYFSLLEYQNDRPRVEFSAFNY